jgi:hypothetical protein
VGLVPPRTERACAAVYGNGRYWIRTPVGNAEENASSPARGAESDALAAPVDLGAFLNWWGTLDEDTRRAVLQVMMAASWRTQEP